MIRFLQLSRKGFTLVEILIALVLMLLILGIVTASIDIYLRQMVINRSEVEEAQLARALLERMSSEIRSAVVQASEEESTTEEIDAELLLSIFGNVASGNSESTANSSSTSNSSANSNSTTLSATSAASEQSADSTLSELAESTVTVKGTIPGIYGDIDWIQIDVTRLPRGELFGSRRMRVGSQFQTDRLSSTKTIYYYLGKDTGMIADTNDPRYKPDQLTGSLGRLTDMTALQYGLFRREFDRQVTQYIVNEGKETDYEQYDEIIAPEVEWIEFAYFDPSAATSSNPAGDWVDYWDMDEKQTFPKAIKITIAIRRQIWGDALIKWTQTTGETIPTNIYSKIVLLPIEIKESESSVNSNTDADSVE
ncbi:MAG: prepilin-type N-terminal cleavage/methylation domain-containing protein [Planctomycetaceae bacterium]|jgi:prepilin-type N-terminal cleavage/methylation domain-containing protein|nr:prepilin-type N-terminal cleavage/methylation domain-containing protein [Planctomycetaceae bacterium]